VSLHTSEQPNEFVGGCHCGNIRYWLRTRRILDELPLRACGCSFCRKHGARYTSDPEGALDVTIAASVSRYQFSTGVVDFLVCPKCGVMTLALTRIGERDYAVVNANTLDDAPSGAALAADFSGETTDESVERRKRNWIGNVAQVTIRPSQQQVDFGTAAGAVK
jgi:hypothetical protein